MTVVKLARMTGWDIREMPYPQDGVRCFAAWGEEDLIAYAVCRTMRAALLELHDILWRHQRVRCCSRAGGRCENCGRPAPITTGEAHHDTFRSHGGSMKLENLIWLCRGCHEIPHRTGNGRLQLRQKART